jgi:hypothetical protein
MENIATKNSSQFVSCIELMKKIVKQKTRSNVQNSAPREGADRLRFRQRLSP